MATKKITGETELDAAVKKTHRQLQGVSNTLRDTKKVLADVRKGFDEKLPAGLPDADKKEYELIMRDARAQVDKQIKQIFKDVEQTIAATHRALKF